LDIFIAILGIFIAILDIFIAILDIFIAILDILLQFYKNKWKKCFSTTQFRPLATHQQALVDVDALSGREELEAVVAVAHERAGLVGADLGPISYISFVRSMFQKKTSFLQSCDKALYPKMTPEHLW
jgi:disulfide bond formation protein DsbB